MPSSPVTAYISRNGGPNSIRSTISLDYSASFSVGTVVCCDSLGKIHPYSTSHPNDPIIGIVENIVPPMKTEINVVIDGIVNLEWIKPGKTYFLGKDGEISEEGEIAVLQGISEGNGVFTRPLPTRNEIIPTGTMMPFCGLCPPSGWLICNGSMIFQEKYPKLHSVLIEENRSICLNVVSSSSKIIVLAYDGNIAPGTQLLLSTLGWNGKVLVMGCTTGLLTVAETENKHSFRDIAIGSVCCLHPILLENAFLPAKLDTDFRWIIKT